MESLDGARRQQALSWELRTSISLARLRRDHGRIGQAHEALAATYARFTEGFATADLEAARKADGRARRDAISSGRLSKIPEGDLRRSPSLLSPGVCRPRFRLQ